MYNFAHLTISINLSFLFIKYSRNFILATQWRKNVISKTQNSIGDIYSFTLNDGMVLFFLNFIYENT